MTSKSIQAEITWMLSFKTLLLLHDRHRELKVDRGCRFAVRKILMTKTFAHKSLERGGPGEFEKLVCRCGHE